MTAGGQDRCDQCKKVGTWDAKKGWRWRSPLTWKQEHRSFCSDACERAWLVEHPDPILPIRKAPPMCTSCNNTGVIWLVGANGDLCGQKRCTCEAARRAAIPGGLAQQITAEAGKAGRGQSEPPRLLASEEKGAATPDSPKGRPVGNVAKQHGDPAAHRVVDPASVVTSDQGVLFA